MGTLVGLVAVVAVIVWIFLTMPAGRALAARLGLHRFVRAGAPQEDRDFLLRVCGSDRGEVRQRLDVELERFPELTEAETYRKAIRTYMNSKGDPPRRDSA